MELVQERKVDEIVLLRCSLCGGLRSASQRHASRQNGRCHECRQGRVVYAFEFYDFWLEQFTPAEIKDMARAIDAVLGLRIG